MERLQTRDSKSEIRKVTRMFAKEPGKRAEAEGCDDRAFNKRGSDYDEQQQYEKAIAKYSRAIQLEPDSSEAHFRRAIAYEEAGRIREAVQDYKKSIKLAPKEMQLQRHYARCRIQKLKQKGISEATGLEDKDY
jgi:tetratricopeptide (TPR) repeat protein